MANITFDAVPTNAPAKVIVVTGSTTGAVNSLQFGTTLSSLSPIPVSNQRFSVVLELSPGKNSFFFQPYDISGSALLPSRISINYSEEDVELFDIQNSLDHHGARMGHERLPGERNVSYKTRLLQGASVRALGRIGTPITMATELGFPASLDMIRIYVARTTYDRPKLTNPYIRVTLNSLQYTGDELTTTDGPIIFHGGDPYYTPTSTLSPFGKISIKTIAGVNLAGDDYEYLAESNRIWLKNSDYYDKDLVVTYTTVSSIALSSASDLSTLETAVDATGSILMELLDSDYHDGTTSQGWIIPTDWVSLSTNRDFPADAGRDNPGVYLSVSEVKAYVLHELRSELLNGEGSGLGTDLERYVDEINEKDRRTWDKIIVGHDGLRDGTINPLYDGFPHLFDPIRGLWYVGATAYNIHTKEIEPELGASFYGIQKEEWHSGVGPLYDLEPGIVAQELRSYADIVEESKIPINIIYGSL